MISKVVNFVCLVLISLAVAQCTAEDISDSKWFNCFGDFCNIDGTEQFCSTKFQKCRHCSEVVDDCFTSEMPLNCTETCLNNYEKKILKTALEILCPVLSQIRNGNHNGSLLKRYAPEITVITSCNDGFQLIGENTTTCTSDGQWSNNLPICEQMLCANPPPIRNGKWVPLHEHTDQFTHGHILNPKCDTGFRIDNPTLLTCYEGLWKSNATFVPSCFKQGESTNTNLWLFLFISVIVLLLISFIYNMFQWRRLQTLRKHRKKIDKDDVELGKRSITTEESMGGPKEETQKLLNKKQKPDDSPEVISLDEKRKPETRRNVSSTQNCLPESNTANRSELPQPSNITGDDGKIVLKVITNNYIDNTNNNHATVTHTGDGGDHTTPKSTREEDRVNDTSPEEPNVPHHENDNSPIEETGFSIQPENPDSQDVNVSQRPERVPNESMQIKPVEADDVVLARPEGVPCIMESPRVIAQLNVDQPGGTVPMKSISTDSNAFVGTQPLKHDDDFTGNNDYTRVRNSRDADRSISQDESLNNIEIDEDDDTMSSQRVDGDHTDENVH